MTAIFIQARMSSSRLPGKVLLDLSGKPVLRWVVDRCLKARFGAQVVVLTSTERDDDVIASYCKSEGIDCFRGPLEDVLERFYLAAEYYNVTNFVRITADCPFVEPTIIDTVIVNGISNKHDYTGLTGNFPDGLDCTFFSRKAVTWAHHKANKSYQREHIGQYIEENINDFSCGGVTIFDDDFGLRLTLDEQEDYIFLQRIVKSLNTHIFSVTDILELHRNEPSLSKINSKIIRNEGLIKSKEAYDADW